MQLCFPGALVSAHRRHGPDFNRDMPWDRTRTEGTGLKWLYLIILVLCLKRTCFALICKLQISHFRVQLSWVILEPSDLSVVPCEVKGLKRLSQLGSTCLLTRTTIWWDLSLNRLELCLLVRTLPVDSGVWSDVEGGSKSHIEKLWIQGTRKRRTAPWPRAQTLKVTCWCEKHPCLEVL